eukprot:6186684-Pleurochrysis_carterae.AAC.1
MKVGQLLRQQQCNWFWQRCCVYLKQLASESTGSDDKHARVLSNETEHLKPQVPTGSLLRAVALNEQVLYKRKRHRIECKLHKYVSGIESEGGPKQALCSISMQAVFSLTNYSLCWLTLPFRMVRMGLADRRSCRSCRRWRAAHCASALCRHRRIGLGRPRSCWPSLGWSGGERSGGEGKRRAAPRRSRSAAHELG